MEIADKIIPIVKRIFERFIAIYVDGSSGEAQTTDQFPDVLVQQNPLQPDLNVLSSELKTAVYQNFCIG